jgi:hypothetical protein
VVPARRCLPQHKPLYFGTQDPLKKINACQKLILNCLEGIKAQEPKGQKVDMMNLKKTKGCDFDLLRGLPPKRKMLPNIMTEWRWHKRILRFKPMSSLGQIRLILLAAMPLSACGCNKFQIDALGDHLCTCTALSGATGRLIKSLTSFAQDTKCKRNRWLGAGVSDVGTYSWRPTSRMRRVRCLWCWISASPTNASEVTLTLVLMDTYDTRMT